MPKPSGIVNLTTVVSPATSLSSTACSSMCGVNAYVPVLNLLASPCSFMSHQKRRRLSMTPSCIRRSEISDAVVPGLTTM